MNMFQYVELSAPLENEKLHADVELVSLCYYNFSSFYKIGILYCHLKV